MKLEINLIKKHRGIVLRIVDICLVVFSCYLVLFFKYDNFSTISREAMVNTIMLNIFILQLSLTFFESYKNITSAESGKDYLIYGFACTIACLMMIAIKLLINIKLMPVKDIILSYILIAVLMITYRVAIRMLQITLVSNEINEKQPESSIKNLLIIGAGEARC